VSNINFDILILFSGGDLFKYPMDNILRTAKFLPPWEFTRNPPWHFSQLKALPISLIETPSV
jgi:hypothetical protein